MSWETGVSSFFQYYFYFSVYKPYIYIAKFDPDNFILFDAIINRIFLISKIENFKNRKSQNGDQPLLFLVILELHQPYL